MFGKTLQKFDPKHRLVCSSRTENTLRKLTFNPKRRMYVMAKVVSIVNKNLNEKFGKIKPEGIEYVYLEYPCSDDELVAALQDADALFSASMEYIRKDVIDRCPKLKLIQTIGAGFDKIDSAAAKEKGIYVCANKGANAMSVAEHAVLLMLATLKRLPYADAQCKAGAESYDKVFHHYRATGHNELSTRTVGLIGLGAIGSRVAGILNGFGSTLLYNDVVRASEEVEKKLNLKFVERDEIYANCDIISYHVPILPSTMGLINKENIAKMKQDAIIINISRGEIANNEDLAEALNSKRIYAGLDVLAPEPPEDGHPLLSLTEEGNYRMVMTPHMAGTSDSAFERMFTWAYEDFTKVILKGERPNNIVNGL